MNDTTKVCLDKLESLLDFRHVALTREIYAKTFSLKPVERIPVVINYGIPADEWPSYDYTEIFNDMEKMLVSELKSVYAGAKLKDDRNYGIRANYGTGIISSVFGCPIRVFNRMLPCAVKNENAALIRHLVADGISDVDVGLCAKAFETLRYFKETLAGYPKIMECVGSMLLDIQGPFDNASIIMGSDVYYLFSDEPGFLNDLLKLITDVTRRVIRKHRDIDGMPLNEDAEMNSNLGGMVIRNDSTINLSRELYDEHIRPHDEALLRDFTGSIHFCGKAGHLIGSMLEIQDLTAINPFQSEFYDLSDLYEKCLAKGKGIFNWTAKVDEISRLTINTGFSYSKGARDFDSARLLLDQSHSMGWIQDF